MYLCLFYVRKFRFSLFLSIFPRFRFESACDHSDYASIFKFWYIGYKNRCVNTLVGAVTISNMRKRKTRKKVFAKDAKGQTMRALFVGGSCVSYLILPFLWSTGRIHAPLVVQSERKKNIFSSLTLSGHRRNLTVLRLEWALSTSTPGVCFETWRCVCIDRLELTVFNWVQGRFESRKAGPGC